MANIKTVLLVLLLAAGALASTDAAAQSPPRVPLIFIPGIGGSVLAERSNPEKVYFGDVKETMDRFAKLELPLDRSKDILASSDVLRSAQRARGDEVDQYILLIRRLETLGYKENRDLLLFHYDWRRSNLETADRLRQFIVDKGLAGRPVDIIAHSMGGLVATDYIQKFASEQKVRNFIAMGTPFYGAAKAIRALLEGFAVFGIENFLVVSAGDSGRVYRVFASMDSIYELLPTYPDCCHGRLSDKEQMRAFSMVGEDAVWERFDLFLKDKTGAPSNPQFLQHVRANLAEQRRLVDLPMPANVRLYAVVSKSAPTTLVQFQGAKIGFRQHVWGIGKNAGDGTVPAISALGHVSAGNIIWSAREHQLIFADNAIWGRLKAILLQ